MSEYEKNANDTILDALEEAVLDALEGPLADAYEHYRSRGKSAPAAITSALGPMIRSISYRVGGAAYRVEGAPAHRLCKPFMVSLAVIDCNAAEFYLDKRGILAASEGRDDFGPDHMTYGIWDKVQGFPGIAQHIRDALEIAELPVDTFGDVRRFVDNARSTFSTNERKGKGVTTLRRHAKVGTREYALTVDIRRPEFEIPEDFVYDPKPAQPMDYAK